MSGRAGHPGQQLVEWEPEQGTLKVKIETRMNMICAWKQSSFHIIVLVNDISCHSNQCVYSAGTSCVGTPCGKICRLICSGEHRFGSI